MHANVHMHIFYSEDQCHLVFEVSHRLLSLLFRLQLDLLHKVGGMFIGFDRQSCSGKKMLKVVQS